MRIPNFLAKTYQQLHC